MISWPGQIGSCEVGIADKGLLLLIVVHEQTVFHHQTMLADSPEDRAFIAGCVADHRALLHVGETGIGVGGIASVERSCQIVGAVGDDVAVDPVHLARAETHIAHRAEIGATISFVWQVDELPIFDAWQQSRCSYTIVLEIRSCGLGITPARTS